MKGKVIWITGASSGIGEALTYALASSGNRLILSARRKDELERVKGNCRVEQQADISLLPLDLTEPETLALSTEAAIQVFGHIDVLINNGGISQRSLVLETEMSVVRRLMEVNYFGSVALTNYLLPHFVSRKSGHIAVVSSVTGIFGTPYRSAYAASKHALHGYFDSLRAELWSTCRDAIAVSIICPGFIHTPITLAAVTGDGTPLGKMDDAQYRGKPAEWCAQKIIHALDHRKEEVYIGGKEVLGVYLKRWFPKLFSRVIRTAKVR